jgi:hypothetical protein
MPVCRCSACLTLGQLVDLRRRQIHEAQETREALERAAAAVDRRHRLNERVFARPANGPAPERGTR